MIILKEISNLLLIFLHFSYFPSLEVVASSIFNLFIKFEGFCLDLRLGVSESLLVVPEIKIDYNNKIK